MACAGAPLDWTKGPEKLQRIIEATKESYERPGILVDELIIPRTARRWNRVNLSLHANLPYGSTTLMPDPQLFGPWYSSIVDKIDAALTDIKENNGRITAILGGHGDLEVEGRLQSDGVVFLKALAISGFRMVRVPRVWDDPGRREAERDPEVELGRLARTFRATFDECTKRVSELATWIRYSPPIIGSKGARTRVR